MGIHITGESKSSENPEGGWSVSFWNGLNLARQSPLVKSWLNLGPKRQFHAVCSHCSILNFLLSLWKFCISFSQTMLHLPPVLLNGQPASLSPAFDAAGIQLLGGKEATGGQMSWMPLECTFSIIDYKCCNLGPASAKFNTWKVPSQVLWAHGKTFIMELLLQKVATQCWFWHGFWQRLDSTWST